MVIHECFELRSLFGKGLQRYHAVHIVEVLDDFRDDADKLTYLIFNEVGKDVQV